MSSHGTVNYQTATQFEEAVMNAFRLAQEQTPDDPRLKSVSNKLADAETAFVAFKSYADQMALQKTQDDGSAKPSQDESVQAGQTAAMALLKQKAVQKEKDADVALRKWYSNHWREKQTRR